MADTHNNADNVIAVTFDEDSSAYEALTELKQLDAQGQIGVRAAAVVVRGGDGKIAIRDEVADSRIADTATGGILGLLIGIIGGPLGILIGGATGVLVGALFDEHDEDEAESVLEEFSRSARVGRTTLLAEVSEPSADVVDTAMSRLSGSVLRRSVEGVEAEIASAEEAQRAAKRQARKLLREQRRTKARAEIRAKIEALKAKLHIRGHTHAHADAAA